MTGLIFKLTQLNGVTTEFVSILDIRIQPFKHIDIQLGYFVSKEAFDADSAAVHSEYFELDVERIDLEQPLLIQILKQLVSKNGPCPGGTEV